MQTDTRGVNVLFAVVIALLAAASLIAMYLNRNLPVIREGVATPAPESGQLPAGHPPVNQSAVILQAEQEVQRDPQNPALQARLGNAYYDATLYDKAIAAYEQSLRLKPQDPSVETDMATCYHFKGQHDQALEILGRVLRYRPGFPQALFNKGIILQIGKHDNQGAIAAWQELLRDNPGFPQRAELEDRIRQLKAAGNQ
jgi:cytochrome c-type biogenesis protein CcmH/NrfG